MPKRSISDQIYFHDNWLVSSVNQEITNDLENLFYNFKKHLR